MTSSIIRNKLRSFIENADDSELKKIFSFVKNELEEPLDSFLEDENFLKELERRSNEIKTGKVKGITWEEMKKSAFL